MEEKIPIGDLILQEMKKQDRSIAYLAKEVVYSHNTMCKILKRDHLDTDLLLKISKVLKYSFFAHYSVFLKEQRLFTGRETNISGKEKIFIGNLIHQELKKQRRSITWPAEKTPYNYSALYKILKRNHIDTNLLLSISKVLKYDFFVHYSTFLKEHLGD